MGDEQGQSEHCKQVVSQILESQLKFKNKAQYSNEENEQLTKPRGVGGAYIEMATRLSPAGTAQDERMDLALNGSHRSVSRERPRYAERLTPCSNVTVRVRLSHSLDPDP